MMADRKGRKRSLVVISSSDDDDDDDDDEESQEESESEEEDEDDDDFDEEASASTSCVEVSDDESDSQAVSVYDRIISLLREGSDLQDLNLNECKAYLRNHGLRLSGTKAECIERISEHWRIKDGNGESLYPRSSFTINCTGDVCKGDVVVFSQKVYEKFNKMMRRGRVLGKRKVAGRIVKESYGAAKQQHTFTVEVLWSKGINKLPALSPLLVKGRNLYKLNTYRQRWENENERSKVLAEKHKRGAAARFVRAKNTSHKDTGARRENHSHHKPPQKKHNERDKGKLADRHGKALVRKRKSKVNFVKSTEVGVSSYMRNQNFTHPVEVRDPTFLPYPSTRPRDSRNEFHHQRPPSGFPNGQDSTSMMRLPHFRPYTNPSPMPFSEHQGFNRGPYPHHAFGHFPRLINTYRPRHPPFRTEVYEKRRYG